MDSSAEGSANGGSKTAERTVKSMNVYKKDTMKDLVKDNSYVGRGIVIGKTEDGTKAAVAYFIMGRSENSRNRIFKEEGEDVMIYPFDASKVEDPSLIIYAPIRKLDGILLLRANPLRMHWKPENLNPMHRTGHPESAVC